MADGFIFYASFFEALSDLDDSTQLQAYQAICKYALTGEVMELTGAASAVFKLVKPQIDANARRRANGKRGGRPKQEESKEEANDNQKETKKKPNRNQTETKCEPKVKEKVKEKEKEKDIKHKRGALGNVLLTDDEYNRLAVDYGEALRDECIVFLDEYIAEKGYKSKSHNLAIRRWVASAVEERKTRAKPRRGVVTPMLAHGDDYDAIVKQMAKGG